MLKPSTWEGGLPVFLREDIDLYGLPEYWGYDQWICIDGQPQYVADPCDFIISTKPVHHYSR
jgi:hypothetical protein